MKVLLRVRRKGVLILPKKLREEAGIREGDDVLAEIKEGAIVLRSLKPKVVDVDPALVERLLSEEHELEARKHGGIFEAKEDGS